jgi:hypothetical protein
MDKISTLIPRVLKKHGLKAEADASLVVHETNRLLQAYGAPEGITAAKFMQGILFIETVTSIEAHEAHALTDELLQAIKKQFPDSQIGGVRILREKTTLVS